ncbi:MAG: ATP phosphoribosyltransferase [Rhizobiaceae bacterium]|jgi:ATP phosphoribosyltransferase|nr:ATP phosphoribosyltransferase [Rhizobiaceae bacterium]
MITLALPSKGRLKDDAIARLAAIGCVVEQTGAGRSYRGQMHGAVDADVAFLSASEIARELASGTVDCGVTGEDLVRETIPDWAARVMIAAPLGFGRADVVVAVPHVWHDVETMEDLNDVAAGFRARHGRRLRIATKYWRLTQDFFTRTHGVQAYRIVESLGATEGAPASGAADIIVDITSTGETLRANGLRILADGVILQSQACLVQRVGLNAKEAAEAASLAALLNRA